MNTPPPMSYSSEAAKKANSSNRIDKTGKYLGVFTKIKYNAFPSGSEGYLFDFKSTDGQSASNMFVCTVGTDGQVNEIGVNQIAAIMCCLGVQNAMPVATTIKERDFDLGADIDVNVFLYPDAMNLPIGVVLQKELYTNTRTGKDAFRMDLLLSFHADTERTAVEMIEKLDPEQVTNQINVISDLDNRQPNTRGAAATADRAARTQRTARPVAASAGFEDDIPF